MKNYKIIYSVRAESQLQQIIVYIALDNKERAISYAKEIKDRITYLSNFPECGTIINSAYPNKRKLVFDDTYVIGYRIDNKKKTIRILHIKHGASIK